MAIQQGKRPSPRAQGNARRASGSTKKPPASTPKKRAAEKQTARRPPKTGATLFPEVNGKTLENVELWTEPDEGSIVSYLRTKRSCNSTLSLATGSAPSIPIGRPTIGGESRNGRLSKARRRGGKEGHDLGPRRNQSAFPVHVLTSHRLNNPGQTRQNSLLSGHAGSEEISRAPGNGPLHAVFPPYPLEHEAFHGLCERRATNHKPQIDNRNRREGMCKWQITARNPQANNLDPIFDPSFDAHMKGRQGASNHSGLHTLYQPEVLFQIENNHRVQDTDCPLIYTAKVRVGSKDKYDNVTYDDYKLSTFFPDDMCLDHIKTAVTYAWKNYRALKSSSDDGHQKTLVWRDKLIGQTNVKWVGQVNIKHDTQGSFDVLIGSLQTGDNQANQIYNAFPAINRAFM
jgi:hypothetical protein